MIYLELTGVNGKGMVGLLTISQTATNIRNKRAKSGLTQPQVSGQAGISLSYYSQLETGKRNPSLATLYKLAQVFKCYVGELDSKYVSLEKAQRKETLLEVVEIPLIGTIPAGPLDMKEELREGIVPIMKQNVESSHDIAKLYALKISGDSLKEDGIFPGQFVIVDPDYGDIINGHIYHVRVANEVTAKHVYKHNGHYRLVSSTGETLNTKGQDIQIMGRIVLSGIWTKR